MIAKAERIDTTQLEREFATQLSALAEAARKAMEAETAAGGGSTGRKKQGDKPNRQGRRDLRLCDLFEERVEIPDPVLDGKVPRIDTEESVSLRRRRGGFVRLVIVRFKYATESAPTPVGDETEAPVSDVRSRSHASRRNISSSRQFSGTVPTPCSRPPCQGTRDPSCDGLPSRCPRVPIQ